MAYTEIDLIDQELDIIQKKAIVARTNNASSNSSKLLNSIIKNGVQYVEDYLDEYYLEELKQLEKNKIEETQIFNNIDYTYEFLAYKDRVQESIVSDLDNYQYIFKIIGIDIPPKLWDLLFDTMYQLYEKKELEEEFLEDMSQLNRFAVSLALLKTSLVNIDCYIDSLDYLERDYLDKRDIQWVKEKMTGKNSKVISFDDYQKRKTNSKSR